MMKKYFIYLGILVVAATTVACNDSNKELEPPVVNPTFEPTLKISTTIFFNAKGQGDLKRLKLHSNRGWKVEVPAEAASWVTVTPDGGQGSSSEQQVIITLAPNAESKDIRSAVIRFIHESPDTAVRVFEIKQVSDYNFQQDSLALLDIYHQLGGPEWTHPWDLSKPVAQWGRDVKIALGDSWDGVWMGKVNGERRVTNLWFWESNNVVGVVPADLGRITSLMGVRFYNEPRLTGELPLKAWAPCKNLGRITFINCNLSGALTSDFGQFPNVDALELSGNNFTSIEGGFGELPKLVALSLGGNEIGGRLDPKWFDGLSYSVIIDLANNNFEGELDPAILYNKHNLLIMSVRGNRLTGDFPEAVRRHVVWYNNEEPASYFCPQQEGYGFTEGSCE